MIRDAVVLCPIKSDPVHALVEIAPGLYQCGICGYGPSQNGNHGFYAIYGLELRGDILEGVSTQYSAEKGYILTDISWKIDEDGRRTSDYFKSSLAGYAASPADLQELPLPVVVIDKNKWDLPPNVPALRRGMFETPFGPKIFRLTESKPPKLEPCGVKVFRSLSE